MAPRKQSGAAGTRRARNASERREPTPRPARSPGPQARADQHHAAMCRLLASIRDPLVDALGLTEEQVVRHSLSLALYRSAALIVVARRPELAHVDPHELAKEACRLTQALLEVVDDGEPG